MRHATPGVWVLALLLGCGGAVGCKRNVQKDLTREGGPNLKKIFDGAQGYFEKGAVVSRSGTVTALQFPASAPLTPAKPCHKMSGGKCKSTSWNDAPWKVLGFEISGGHRLQYQFVSEGEGRAAMFTARAVVKDPKKGDWIVLERTGAVDPDMRIIGGTAMTRRRVKSLAAIRLSAADRELARCRAYGFVPQVDKRGGVVIKAGVVARAAGKGTGHCLKLWGKRCADDSFRKLYVSSCKNAKKRLSGGQDI